MQFSKKKNLKNKKKKKFLAIFRINKHFTILIIVILLFVVLLGGYASYSVLSAKYPIWPGIPNPPKYSQNSQTICESLNILIIGDSIARGMASESDKSSDHDGNRLQKSLKQFGYCSKIYNEALSGSSACQWRQFWFTEKLNAHPDIDVIVAHFVGNEPCGADATWTSTNEGGVAGNAWLKKNQEAVKSMQSEANAKGTPMYWIIPAPAYRHCFPPDKNFVTALWKYWAHWQRDKFVPADKQINARTPFGEDTYIPKFLFSNGLVGAVRTDKIYNYPDCLHFTSLGYSFMANAVRATIYKEWNQ